MQTIAIAKPNKFYRHYNNYKNISIVAVISGSQVRYYERVNGNDFGKCLTSDIVKSLFLTKRRICNIPFLIKENKDFYALLYKNRVEFKEQAKQLTINY